MIQPSGPRGRARTPGRAAVVVAWQVTSLLEKLQPATIMLDPGKVNPVDRNQPERPREMQAAKQARTDDADEDVGGDPTHTALKGGELRVVHRRQSALIDRGEVDAVTEGLPSTFLARSRQNHLRTFD